MTAETGRRPALDTLRIGIVLGLSLILVFAVYDILVRRTRVTRFLAGMRTERTDGADRGRE